MKGGKERRQLLCCRGARRAWRGEALRTTRCAPWIQGDGGGRWLCSRRVVIESRRCFSFLGSPPSQLAAGWPWPADAGIGPSGVDGISFTVHPLGTDYRGKNEARLNLVQTTEATDGTVAPWLRAVGIAAAANRALRAGTDLSRSRTRRGYSSPLALERGAPARGP